MKYTVLTGATGLLGSYLLKDLLAEGLPVAVLVRGDKREDPRGRIESILQRFEKRLGYAVPRPVVLEGHLGDPGLGLDRDAAQWVRRHADTVLHNAASLEFQHDVKTNEPFRSNVEGTGHVLEFCRATNIRRFHHVSTAYVCGLREGRVLETELDCGQAFGNAYEESKLKSETAVRLAPFLDSVTVFRPAIIVGDSGNGYTPTYHGFYTPLQILYPLIDPAEVTPEGVAGMIEVLGMKGTDAKNFVPVDWISSVMSHVIANPRWHDRCYHLAPADRTRIDLLSEILVETLAIPKRGGPKPLDLAAGQLPKLIETFTGQMDIYRAYWRNDPEFDCTNTRLAAPHLPCPAMDRERMRMLMRFAVLSNFGWPKEKPASIPFDVHRFLDHRCDPAGPPPSLNGSSKEPGFGLRVSGSGGGDWTVRIGPDGRFILGPGLDGDALPTARLNSDLFRGFVEGTLEPARMPPCDVAWENTCADWVDRHGHSLLKSLTTSITASRIPDEKSRSGTKNDFFEHHVPKQPR